MLHTRTSAGRARRGRARHDGTALHPEGFASGCAATTTVMHLLKGGDHVICGDDVYGGTFRLFSKVLGQMGLSFSFVDLAQPGAFEGAVRPETKAVWVETPTNPMMKLVDLDNY